MCRRRSNHGSVRASGRSGSGRAGAPCHLVCAARRQRWHPRRSTDGDAARSAGVDGGGGLADTVRHRRAQRAASAPRRRHGSRRLLARDVGGGDEQQVHGLGIELLKRHLDRRKGAVRYGRSPQVAGACSIWFGPQKSVGLWRGRGACGRTEDGRRTRSR